MGTSYCDIAPGHEWHGPYHEREYGFPLRGDAELFERLILEINQAGLSWLTILKKRDGYRRAFDGFDAGKVARYTAARRAKLMKDEGIVRNRLKIDAVVGNAKAFLAVQEEFGTFDEYIWRFVGHVPMRGPGNRKAVAVSEAMSRELKKRGFRFVGPTICYAFMQAVGMVNDHSATCFKAPRAKR